MTDTDTIKFPAKRKDLMVAMKYLANSGNIQRIVKERNGNIVFYYDFDMAVHQLFDDAGGDEFVENPREYIGFSLKSEREANAIGDLIRRVDEVLAKDKPEDIDSEFVETPRWKEVIRAAKAAIVEFERS